MSEPDIWLLEKRLENAEKQIELLEKALDYAIWRISMGPTNQIQIRNDVTKMLKGEEA